VKLRRRGSIDFPIAGAAVAVQLDGDTVVSCRIVLSAVASHPLEATAAEAFLKGKRASADAIRETADIAAKPARPLDNADLSHFWRKRMVRVVVEQALQQVPEPYRTALILRDLEEMSYEEIAEVLVISLGTVKSRITRGRDALRKKLTGYVREVGPELGLVAPVDERQNGATQSSRESFRESSREGSRGGREVEVTP